jgi:hypothetical protein
VQEKKLDSLTNITDFEITGPSQRKDKLGKKYEGQKKKGFMEQCLM